MIDEISLRREDLAALCRRFHVRRLEVFGSAARGTDFDPARSDADFLVTSNRQIADNFICQRAILSQARAVYG